jgi:hypothetical protein
MHPEKDFGLWEMTSEIAAPLLEGSNVEVEGHRYRENIDSMRYKENLVSRNFGGKRI